MSDITLIGTCPICGKQLVLGVDNKVSCGDHFEITVGDYNRIWDIYTKSMKGVIDDYNARTSNAISILTESLQNANIKLEKGKDEPEKEV